MKALNVWVIYNLKGVVVDEKVMESVEVRKNGKDCQARKQQDIGPGY
jgi:hypothetical protein